MPLSGLMARLLPLLMNMMTSLQSQTPWCLSRTEVMSFFSRGVRSSIMGDRLTRWTIPYTVRLSSPLPVNDSSTRSFISGCILEVDCVKGFWPINTLQASDSMSLEQELILTNEHGMAAICSQLQKVFSFQSCTTLCHVSATSSGNMVSKYCA